MATNIDSWKSGLADATVQALIHRAVFFHEQTIAPDTGTAFGDGLKMNSVRGQHIHFEHTYNQDTPFRVFGFINETPDPKDPKKAIWSSSGGRGAKGISPTRSFVQVFAGCLNGRPVEIGGVKLTKEPYKAYIDAELFEQNKPIGVALHASATQGDIETGKRKCEIKFHTLSRIGSNKIRALQKMGMDAKVYDKKWLWNGCSVGGTAGGLTRKDAPPEKKWKGKDSVGKVLLAIITPPPVRFIQVVTRSLTHGIYNTKWNTHKHTFWG